MSIITDSEVEKSLIIKLENETDDPYLTENYRHLKELTSKFQLFPFF
jgi:hypothetical protein